MKSSQALAAPEWQPTVAAAANTNDADAAGRLGALQGELAAQQPVVSAAVLVATAFRMRDEAGLVDTLRLLTDAVIGLEQRRARNED
jgi:hypothetical protein